MTDEQADHNKIDEPGRDGPGQGPVEPPLNTLAILSLISSLVGGLACCCFLFLPLPVAAIVMGLVSLSQFKARPNQKGKLLAQIGIALGALILLLWVVLLVLQLTGVLVPPDFGQEFRPR